jgi:hypothetical protein
MASSPANSAMIVAPIRPGAAFVVVTAESLLRPEDE